MFNNKTKLALATAAFVMSSGAAAQVDLTPAAGSVVPTTFASELNLTGGVTLTHPGFVLDLPIAINIDTLRYARVDLTGTTFEVAATGATDIAAATVNLVQGGQAGDSFAIFSIDTGATAGTTANTLTITLTSMELSAQSDVSVVVGIYETQTLADAAGDPLGDAVSGTITNFAAGLATTFTAGTTLVADVEAATAFSLFTPGAVDTGTLGTVTLGAAAGVNDSDNTAITLADLIGSFDADLAGNFNFANDGTIAAPTFGTAAAVTMTGAATDGIGGAAGTVVQTTLSASAASWDALTSADTYTFAVDGQAVDVFTDSSYVLTIDVTAAAATSAGTPVAVSDISGTVGNIERNGTNVDIPYITTFSDYNQRLIVVNRGSAAQYTITFVSEDGVSTSPGTAASGTLGANQTTVMRMTDVVDITGATRTAGTISIVSPTGNIDVATTQVNLSDASTDTVVLD